MLPLELWMPDEILKALALVGAVIAFVIGLLQYWRAQQWKRAEWVAQEMKQLFGDPVVQATLLMIDWGSRRIPLFPDYAKPEERVVFLTNHDVARALMPHEERQGENGFSDIEVEIRAAFDRTLDGIERFHSYTATGLVEMSDLQPYLRYWARMITAPSSPPEGETEDRFERLRSYMRKYGFGGALTLLEGIATMEDERALVKRTAPRVAVPRLLVRLGRG